MVLPRCKLLYCLPLACLLFDGEYASDLVRMGMRDADAHRQELIEFFSV